MSKLNNITTGQIYSAVISRSGAASTSARRFRDSAHHRRDQVTHRQGSEGLDVLVVEVGGTVGDIESLPFLEAVRQLRVELGVQNR